MGGDSSQEPLQLRLLSRGRFITLMPAMSTNLLVLAALVWATRALGFLFSISGLADLGFNGAASSTLPLLTSRVVLTSGVRFLRLSTRPLLLV
jgi:hypothetical protein